jgi:ribose transport system substrate-binding protein
MPSFRLALFLHDRLNDYQNLLCADCEQAARQHDIQVLVHSADKSAEAQLRQIRAVLAQPEAIRPRAFVICPVSELTLMPLIHDTAKAGIAWVMLSRWNDAIHELRRQYPKVPIFAVLPDHVEIGRIQGRQLRQLLAAGDEVVCIQGPIATYSTRCRRAGIEKELVDKSDIRWSHLNGDWSELGGERAMKSWLSSFPAKGLPPFIIAAQNDAMAMGARQAVMDWSASGGQLPRGELRVLGCDGSPSYGQRLVTAGQLDGTVVIPPVAGRAVVEIVNAFRTGRQPDAETVVSVRPLPDIETLVRNTRR